MLLDKVTPELLVLQTQVMVVVVVAVILLVEQVVQVSLLYDTTVYTMQHQW
jgi:hypothetical protein